MRRARAYASIATAAALGGAAVLLELEAFIQDPPQVGDNDPKRRAKTEQNSQGFIRKRLRVEDFDGFAAKPLQIRLKPRKARSLEDGEGERLRD